jgi:hypothetical protein
MGDTTPVGISGSADFDSVRAIEVDPDRDVHTLLSRPPLMLVRFEFFSTSLRPADLGQAAYDLARLLSGGMGRTHSRGNIHSCI